MLKEDELIGVIVSTRQEVRPFTENRSNCSRTSPLRPSSPSRTRGCSTNCASAPLTSPNEQRPHGGARAADGHVGGASGHQSAPLATLSRCSQTMLEKAVRICEPTSAISIAGTATPCTRCDTQYATCFRRSTQAFAVIIRCRRHPQAGCWQTKTVVHVADLAADAGVH